MASKRIIDLPVRETLLDTDLIFIGLPTGDPDEGKLFQMEVGEFQKQTWSNGVGNSIGEGASIGAGLTRFYQLLGRGLGAGYTDETFVQATVVDAAKASHLVVVTDDAQPGDGDQIVSFRVNNGDAISVTIPAGSPAGVYSNVIDEFDVSLGDLVNYKRENQSSSTGAHVISIGVKLIGTTV